MISSKVFSFTPVESGDCFTSIFANYVGPIFGGREVAVLTDPIEISSDGSRGCIAKMHEPSLLLTCVKIFTYIISLGIFPLLAILLNLVVRYYNQFHYITEAQTPHISQIDLPPISDSLEGSLLESREEEPSIASPSSIEENDFEEEGEGDSYLSSEESEEEKPYSPFDYSQFKDSSNNTGKLASYIDLPSYTELRSYATYEQFAPEKMLLITSQGTLFSSSINQVVGHIRNIYIQDYDWEVYSYGKSLRTNSLGSFSDIERYSRILNITKISSILEKPLSNYLIPPLIDEVMSYYNGDFGV